MRSLAGQLLVAPRNRVEPDVVHTVVLVVRQTGQETLGVITNRPVDQTVLVFGGEKGETVTVPQRQIYIGGPLMGPLLAVHTDEALAEAEILPKLFITTRESQVFALLQQAEHRFKVFAGHVGWKPEELERELEETAWRTTPATAEYVFSLNDELWEEVSWHIQEATAQDLFHTRHVPRDPQFN